MPKVLLVTNDFPSGLKKAFVMAALCRMGLPTARPVSAAQRRTVLSAPRVRAA